MRITVVLVHYHTPELLTAAWEALERDAAVSGFSIEGILVDNGSQPEDRSVLSALPVRWLDPGSNLGYAGGVNLGVLESRGETIVAMNPDVLVRPGCLGALAAALADGAAVAGPRFFWDAERRFLLPPTEERGRLAELRTVLTRTAARRAWRRRAHRFWSTTAPCRCLELSGALLAFPRAVWGRVGPFDEGYRLYFEETDWLLRLAAMGLEPRFVPAAEAIHLYAQSSMGESAASAWFEASQQRFRRRHQGRGFALLIELLQRFPRRPEAIDLPTIAGAPPDVLARAAWLEVSSSPAGFPAAGHRVEPGAPVPHELPAEVWRRLAPGRYFLRLVDTDGIDLASESYERP